MIYLDSCLLIYLGEQDPLFARATLDALSARGDAECCISALVEAECMVGVYKRQDPLREASYTRLFSRFRILDMAQSTFLLAARTRALHRVNMPDALHIACAQENGCAELWTNDNRMAAAAPGMARNIIG